MTLAEVCEEFGINTFQNDEGTWDAYISVIADHHIAAATESDAVCALLKAQYRIIVTLDRQIRLFIAEHTTANGEKLTEGRGTESAAIAALARRLKGAGL